MSPFIFTQNEMEMMVLLIGLPPHPDSPISEFLFKKAPTVSKSAGEQQIKSLLDKGYIIHSEGKYRPDKMLNQSLYLAALGTARIQVSKGNWTQRTQASFVQNGNWIIQYHIAGQSMIIHEPQTISILSAELIPDYLGAEQYGKFSAEMTLQELVLLFKACDAESFYVLSSDEEFQPFSKRELIIPASLDLPWLEYIFGNNKTLKIRIGESQYKNAINSLIEKGFLQEEDGKINLKSKSRMIFDILTDPETTTLYIMQDLPSQNKTMHEMLFWGGRRLLRVDITGPEKVRIFQLPDRKSAEEWIAKVLVRGSKETVDAGYLDGLKLNT